MQHWQYNLSLIVFSISKTVGQEEYLDKLKRKFIFYRHSHYDSVNDMSVTRNFWFEHEYLHHEELIALRLQKVSTPRSCWKAFFYSCQIVISVIKCFEKHFLFFTIHCTGQDWKYLWGLIEILSWTISCFLFHLLWWFTFSSPGKLVKEISLKNCSTLCPTKKSSIRKRSFTTKYIFCEVFL